MKREVGKNCENESSKEVVENESEKNISGKEKEEEFKHKKICFATNNINLSLPNVDVSLIQDLEEEFPKTFHNIRVKIRGQILLKKRGMMRSDNHFQEVRFMIRSRWVLANSWFIKQQQIRPRLAKRAAKQVLYKSKMGGHSNRRQIQLKLAKASKLARNGRPDLRKPFTTLSGSYAL